jgi:4-hydroxy-tetrahydrodipicolinate synthase
MTRGTSTTVRAPRLDLPADELARVRDIVTTALAKRPDMARYGV